MATLPSACARRASSTKRHHPLRFGCVAAANQGVHRNRRLGPGRVMRDGVRIGHGPGGNVFRGRQDLREGIVHPLDNAGLRTEVDAEGQRFEPHRADAVVARAQVQANLGLAETVDRLHRIADHEQRAAVARLPAGGEALEQRELADRGVLKLVHQQVPDAIVEMQGQIGRRLIAAERGERALRDLGEICRAA
jgi:hypothetical protein